MRRLFAALLLAGAAPALAQVEAFRSDASRVPAGKVYHYLKTNVDGTHPERVSIQPAEAVEIGRLPWHVYNFDLASAGFAFRHLAGPKGRFAIGIAGPGFREGPAFPYRGEADVVHVGEEARAGVLCRKRRIDGLGLLHRGGFLRVNQAGGHVEDMEIDLPDNPAWQSFKFKLTGVETLDQAAWESFQKQQLQPR